MNAKFWTDLSKHFGMAIAIAGATVLLSGPALSKSCDRAEGSNSNGAIATPAGESAGGGDMAMEENTIVDIAINNDSFQTLTAALKAAGLVETLAGEGPFTVFAPTDEAFAALPEGTLEELLKPENQDQLIEILTYHVVPGTVKSGDLSSGEVASVEGRAIDVKVESDGIMVNNASVVQADIEASNGIIHVIDRVILPPDM
ncbi:fasciclin domain-containing protein [Phormidium sp. CCY1219]|uniref:fasciclin domain-containing protein n=1 Tax=Phormidium sp. CCY1219 TaxID=2886104 RepID=UPI002D1F7CF3|nr:fasciclin domain-containing protein [Phormidium sp. CCY1219]MEB3828306.1 fasciclin domain-containing protein [Phormidium sp. CCY1219]